jgi:hypothetical protein
MKKTMAFAVAFALWVLATVLSQPAGTLRPSTTKLRILAGTGLDPQVVALLERSCQNCHSSNTEWPLYGRAFPMTLLIERDIRMARSHMDLSRWPEYEESRKRLLLAEIGVVVRNGSMPPRRYTLLHPEAKLNPEEVNEVYQWTRSNRRLLKRLSPELNTSTARE